MEKNKKVFIFRIVVIQAFIILILIVAFPSVLAIVRAQEQTNPADTNFKMMVIIGIMGSVSIPAVAAGIALKSIATAAISALTERESTFGKALVFTAFGESLAIYGLIIALTLLPYLSA
ncbi:MAG: hypothetical protein ACTSXU_07335 [Promethearchaeota archaeon]